MSKINSDVLNEYQPFEKDDYERKNERIGEIEINNKSVQMANESPNLFSTFKSSDLESSKHNNINNITRDKGWSYHTNFCRLKCCLYHHIADEIPKNMQNLLSKAYFLWFGYSLVLILNVFGALAYFISESTLESRSTLGTSVLVSFLLTPLSLLSWYWSLYRAARSNSSVDYFVFFMMIFIQIVITAIQSMGINWLGSCGWFNSFETLSRNTVVGCAMLLIAVLFSFVFLCQVLLMIKVHQKYGNNYYRINDLSDTGFLLKQKSADQDTTTTNTTTNTTTPPYYSSSQHNNSTSMFR